MRRLLRWTFNTLAIASLLLCLATAGLWVRSYWVRDWFLAQRIYVDKHGYQDGISRYQCEATSHRGRLAISLDCWEAPEGRMTLRWEFHFEHPDYDLGDLSENRFDIARDEIEGHPYTMYNWAAPHWSLVSAFAVLPAIFGFRQIRAVRRRRRRSRLGLCPACGYDLRASPDRCPECGRQSSAVGVQDSVSSLNAKL